MGQKVVVIGGGGFGREVLDVIDALNWEHSTTGTTLLDVVGVLDDGHPDPNLLEPYGVEHIGPVTALADLPSDVGYVIGIGDPATKQKIDELCGSRDCPTLVHPSATMGREVQLGPGTIVCSHASLTNHIAIGRHVHVNINSTVGHDAVLGDYTTLSPLVAISGNVRTETCVFLGTGAKVNPGLLLGEGCVVGTGAAVIRDVPSATTVMGVPAKPR